MIFDINLVARTGQDLLKAAAANESYYAVVEKMVEEKRYDVWAVTYNRTSAKAIQKLLPIDNIIIVYMDNNWVVAK
jgi:hypothetical protein